jgi:WD40 repeat protein
VCYVLTEDDTGSPWGITARSDILFAEYHRPTNTLALVSEHRISLWHADLNSRKASFLSESQELSAPPRACRFGVTGETLTVIEDRNETGSFHVEIVRVEDGAKIAFPDNSHSQVLTGGLVAGYIGLETVEFEKMDATAPKGLSGDRKLKSADLTLISSVTGKEVARTSSPHGFRAHSFSKSGLFAYAGDGSVTVLDLSKGGTVKTKYRVPGVVHKITYERGEKLISAYTTDKLNYYNIYNANASNPVRTFVRPRRDFVFQNGIQFDEADYLSINVDRDLIAVSEGAGPEWSTVVNVFSLVTNKLVRSFPHSERVTEAVLSNDGRYLAMTGWGAVVSVRDINSGREIVALKPAIKGGWSNVHVSFSSNTRYILTFSGQALGPGRGRTLGLWLFQPEDLIAEACRRVDRNLEKRQWSDFFGVEPYCQICPSLP